MTEGALVSYLTTRMSSKYCAGLGTDTWRAIMSTSSGSPRYSASTFKPFKFSEEMFMSARDINNDFVTSQFAVLPLKTNFKV